MVLGRESFPHPLVARRLQRAARREPRALLGVAVAAAVLSTAACGDANWAASFGPGGVQIGVSTQPGNAVLGRWFRVDGAPGTTSSETTWDFRSDGTASRTIVTRTANGDAIATGVQTFRWSAGAGVIVLDFGPPSFQVQRVPFSIDYGVNATVLTLDGVQYNRLGP
jgi:hypothetical protein